MSVDADLIFTVYWQDIGVPAAIQASLRRVSVFAGRVVSRGTVHCFVTGGEIASVNAVAGVEGKFHTKENDIQLFKQIDHFSEASWRTQISDMVHVFRTLTQPLDDKKTIRHLLTQPRAHNIMILVAGSACSINEMLSQIGICSSICPNNMNSHYSSYHPPRSISLSTSSYPHSFISKHSMAHPIS